MSITTTDRDAGPYTGTGLVSVYPFNFKVFQASDLLVVRTDTGGEQSMLALTTDYSATLNADQNASPGGYITLTSALASGYQLTITSNVPMTQPARLTNGGGFFPQTIEDALDRLTILFQQLGLVGSVQALRVPEIGGIPTFPAKSSRASRVAAFDADGNPIAIVGVDAGSAAALDLSLRVANNTVQGSGQIGFFQSGAGAAARTALDKLREVVSVKDFGAVGNGIANDTAAIQAAFNSGAKRVVFPPGVYLISSQLTVPNWLHIQGEAYQPTIGVGSGAVVLKFTQSSGVAMSLGFNALIERIVFWNSAASYNDTTKALSGSTAVALDLASDNVTLNEVSFHLWETAVRFGPSSFYVKTRAVEFNRCTNGYRVNGTAPYNVHIDAPISRDTAIFFLGQTANPARNVKVMGGSIEGYSVVASGVLDFSAFGTYFETISQRAGCFAIDPAVNGASVGLFGCTIYMNHTARFVNMSGLTTCALNSRGNQWTGVAPSGSIFMFLPSSGSVSLGGDSFGTSHPTNALYVDSVTNAAKFNGITFPLLPSGNTQAGYSEMQMIGPRGYVAVALTAQPAVRVTGMTVMADGVSWDPLTLASNRPYWVIWQGDRWRNPGG